MRSVVHLILVLNLFLALTSQVSLSASHSDSGDDRLLFGIKLDKSTKGLLAAVEKGFGKRIRTEWLPSTHQMAGISTVEEDGTPAIRLSRKHAHLDVIVHELSHLQLKLVGYPSLAWIFPTTMGSESNRATLQHLSAMIYDPILHSIFNPEAIRTGIDPGRNYKNIIRQQLRDGTIAKLVHATDDRGNALNLFYALTEFGNNDVVKKLERLLIAQGKQESVELGRRLHETVQRLNPNSPESSITTLLSCLNLLFPKELTFREQKPWATQRKGTFDEAFAVVVIERSD